MAAEMLVQLHDVSKQYRTRGDTVEALAGVTLELADATLTVVRGRSGSGKTTLLNMIGGLDRPSSGRVVVAGTEVSALSEEALVDYRRDTVGFVFQAFGLLPILTAAENVEIPLRLRRVEPAERTRRVHELLRLVDLEERMRHRPPELSGGEQQRVAIARALANEPRLLVADEPTAQLDSQRARTVMGLLRHLVDHRGIAAVVATHDPLLMGSADRVVELRDGALLEAAPAAALGASRCRGSSRTTAQRG